MFDPNLSPADPAVTPPADAVPSAEPAAAPVQEVRVSPDGYRDDDLVYVDPEARVVIGRVEWSNSGRPKSLPRPDKFAEAEEPEEAAPAAPVAGAEGQAPAAAAAAAPGGRKGGRGRRGAPGGDRGRGGRPKRVRYYPWGTYRSMKRIYKLEGKVIEERGNATLDDVLPRALTEAFWD